VGRGRSDVRFEASHSGVERAALGGNGRSPIAQSVELCGEVRGAFPIRTQVQRHTHAGCEKKGSPG
jgi:hypothetical protein